MHQQMEDAEPKDAAGERDEVFQQVRAPDRGSLRLREISRSQLILVLLYNSDDHHMLLPILGLQVGLGPVHRVLARAQVTERQGHFFTQFLLFGNYD